MLSRYIKILIFSLATLLMVACSDSIDAPSGSKDFGPVTVNGDDISLRVTLEVPELNSCNSRAFADKPAYDRLHLYLIEFDDNGSPVTNNLVRTYQAEQETVSGDIVTFRVNLKASDNAKILHLIAIPDDEELTVGYGLEANVIPHLTVSYGTDAYWRRISFPGGYSSEADDGSWHPDPDLVAKLTGVKLVRNFAKIAVNSTAPGFTFKGFAVINLPQAGTIAPWSQRTLSFPQFVKPDGTAPSYDEMRGSYSGILPSGVVFDNQQGAWAPAMSTAPQYLYERPASADRPTFVIICGRRAGDTADSYYKLDIGKPDAEGVFRNYNILRNFAYTINITKVDKTGYASAESAMNGVVSNNFSFSLDTSHMLNMSDGKQIVYVSETNMVLTDAANEEVIRFKYKFRDISDKKYYNDDDNVTFVGLEPGDVIKSVVKGTTNDADGWRTVTITCHKATTETKTQEFTILNKNGLGRTIHMSLHQKWRYTLARAYGAVLDNWLTGSVSSGTAGQSAGDPVTLFFDIPNDLPEAVFPLTFILESNWQNIENDPDTGGDLVVTEGPSYFAVNNGENRIKFEKTVTLTDYNSPLVPVTQNNQQGTVYYDSEGNVAGHRIRCRMRTIRSLANLGVAVGQTITIRVWVQEENGNFVTDGTNNVITFTRKRNS